MLISRGTSKLSVHSRNSIPLIGVYKIERNLMLYCTISLQATFLKNNRERHYIPGLQYIQASV